MSPTKLARSTHGGRWRDGLWHDNPVAMRLLGLCPLLAVTTNLINGLGLGMATTLVLAVSSVSVSLLRNLIHPELRLAVLVVIIACLVSMVDLAMSALFGGLHEALGIFVPLIAANCIVIDRAESCAATNPPLAALIDALAAGLGFSATLLLFGGLREALGRGTLMADAELIFGEHGRHLTMTLFADFPGALLAVLPPGALIGLGLMLAAKNFIDQQLQRRDRKATEHVASADLPTAGGRG